MQQVIAMYHFYFVQKLLSKIEGMGSNTGDFFGLGEDAFVIEIYEYSVAIFAAVEKHEQNDGANWQESSLFDLIEFSAQQFVFESMRKSNLGFAVMPKKSELIESIKTYLKNL